MSLTKTVGFVAVTTLAIGGAAFGTEQNNDTLAQIAELKAQIASLKGAENGQWLTEQRASEIRGIVTDVLADAETRSSLQGAAAGSGYNGGFFLSSADGNYSMKINVLEQIRWSFNNSENGTNPSTTTQANGFENKRTRLTFGGNMVDSSWNYKLSYYLAYSNDAEFSGQAAPILADAFVSKDFSNGFTVTVGQFKLPFSAEYNLDAGNLQFTDYSLANTVAGQIIGGGYGQGIQFGYSADQFRVHGAYVNAISEQNQSWNAGSPGTEWALSGRAEFKFAGDWGQFNDAQSWKGEAFGAVAGLGYSSEMIDNAAGTNPSALTLDITVDFGGANVTGAYYWADADTTAGNNPTAYVLAGGVFLADDFELVARYESIDNDTGANDSFGTFSVGGNWYVSKNAAKVSVDLGYGMDAFPTDQLYANWVAADQDGQWVVRGQMSFSF
jgi:hypothetical protein